MRRKLSECMEQLPETDQEPALSRGGRAETPALGLARGRLESEPDWLYVSFPYTGSSVFCR